MNIRRATLLVTVGVGLALFQIVYLLSVGLYVHATYRNPVTLLPSLGVLAADIAAALFFFFLYGEASKLTGAEARARAAMASAVLMSLSVIDQGWQIGNTISLSRVPHVSFNFSVPVELAFQLFFVIGSIGWTVLFLAFASKSRAFLSGMIPKLAGFLAVVLVIAIIESYVPRQGVSHGHGSFLFDLWRMVLSLYSSISLIVFFVVLRREWDSRLPVNENVARTA